MNIGTAKQLQSELEKTVSGLVSVFEKNTGMTVFNLFVYENKSGNDGHITVSTVLRQNEKLDEVSPFCDEGIPWD